MMILDRIQRPFASERDPTSTHRSLPAAFTMICMWGCIPSLGDTIRHSSDILQLHVLKNPTRAERDPVILK